MAPFDWSQCSAVESIAGKVGGAWVFRGTRLPVATVIENLEDLSFEEVMERFDVTREQINECLISSRGASRVRRRMNRPSMLILFDHGTPKGIIGRLQATLSSLLKRRDGTDLAIARCSMLRNKRKSIYC